MGKRLPTVAEWEKAARGTDGGKYPWGNEEPVDGVHANFGKIKIGDFDKSETVPARSYEKGKSPHGAYDMAGNVKEFTADWYGPNYGTVVLGTSHDTPEFAVDTIELWLKIHGWRQYPNLKDLLILCDAGGSNGYRTRGWKYYLYHKIANPHGLRVTVCHYPPGASKWNPIEHRLFSFISINWAGVPLRSCDIMINFIRNTTTQPGLKVDAHLNKKNYATGIKITDEQMKEIRVERHKELPELNYTICP